MKIHIIAIAAFAAGGSLLAQDFNQGPVFALIEENDLVVDTDRHYTQGIRVSFLGADNSVPGFLKRISNFVPATGYEPRAIRTGVVIGQSIFTPADTQKTALMRDDRPYAGWLYIGLPLQRRGLLADRWVTLESLQLDLGVVGKYSLAEQAQKWVHETRGLDEPQGWDNQLETEPGVALKYYRAVRFSPKGWEPYLDITPHGGGSAGNTETSLRAGIDFRTGLNLPDDFGVQTISSLLATEGGRSPINSKWAAYFFAGAEGWLVGYSTFLQGNMYHKSHSVDPEWAVLEMKAGGAIEMKYGQVALAFVYRTREFRGQDDNNSYGSVTFKVKF